MTFQQIRRRIPIRLLAGAMTIVCPCSLLGADPNGAAPNATAPSASQPPVGGQSPQAEQVPPEQAAAADWLEKSFAGQQMPESVKMLVAIARGSQMGPAAPDFSLKTQDGKQTIRLGELRGAKPIVLVFGNFTCGPFRSMYPLVDELCQRHQDRATFLAVYVREAHPTDGWRMESNDAVGVEPAQPATYDERVAVAQRRQATLNYSMPLVVDEINDPVGNAYSGMPARLYLIDAEGKAAYKSGRGPFGFKPVELEQALVMLLLDQQLKSAPPIAETTE